MAPWKTPGPWELRGPLVVYGNLQRDQNWTGDRVAVLSNPADGPLIVTAPELLDAAAEFLDYFTNAGDDASFVEEIRLADNLRAAIVKAQGGAA